MYQFADYSEIANFLRSHPKLIDILIECQFHVRAVFGQTGVTLRVSFDPSGQDDPQLRALVQTTQRPSEALRSLSTLDDRWWLEVPFGIAELLCIDVEYV